MKNTAYTEGCGDRASALERYDELAAPYATVIDVDPAKLPSVETVNRWSGERHANALRHDRGSPEYNSSFRQLIHVAYKVAYKVAAEMGGEYVQALENEHGRVGSNVTSNLLQRHILPILG